MKTTLLTCISSMALAASLFGQDPTTSPIAAPTTPALASTPVTAASPRLEDDLESRIEEKVKRGLHISIGKDDRDRERERNRDRVRVHNSSDDDEDFGSLMAIPIVGIIFSAIFGTPVMIVAAIMFFSYLKSRSLHRTVRNMVEKGQEVPAALFVSPPPAIRARSDMRRGVVLIMVGLGLMIFFGAVNDWEGGSWALGIIPFLIGAGYLLVWRLEGNKPNFTTTNTSTDNIPRVP